ncbi:XRE family transcriptional regulator [Streptomyces sp. NBC_00094]|uniref:telomere-protecting terminal protein Tpg n=1 Tax=Streptomyces sp. NBC_00094 TaxID=2903620 RepID=UPI00224F2671|nr:XRE family transcriptional regulator [Streptomyces sp. NBC_00094]MCX5395254.1 XRE family transcriptional regulator [Streptomyces sp. NBC_00094]
MAADSFGDSLDRALEGAFTRPAPKGAQAQMKYLVKQLKGTKAVAQALGVSQRTVERYVAGKLKRPRQELRERMEREVRKRWQPQIRAKARKKAASTDGLVVSTRARFGFTAAPGTTDDARIRDITQALPPQWADRLYTAREQGADERRLQRIAAEGLAEMYFRADNTRAHGLGVEFTDVQHIEIEL